MAPPPTEQAQHANFFWLTRSIPTPSTCLATQPYDVSDDGGVTWPIDVNLDNAITENHRFSYFGDISVIKDMIFVRGEKGTHFAVGNAGVFFTLNGTNWTRLLSTSAFPSHPYQPTSIISLIPATARCMSPWQCAGFCGSTPFHCLQEQEPYVVPCGQLTIKP